MQDNLRLVMWTVAALVAAWVIVMTAQRNLFIYSDVNSGLHGTIPMDKTDIGAQCGAKWVNSNQQVIYKVDNAGHLLYLCPRGLWPIQDTIQAAALTNGFKTSVSDETLSALNVLYPGATNPVPDAGTVVTSPTRQSTPIPINRQQTTPSSPLNPAPHLAVPNQAQPLLPGNAPQNPPGKRGAVAKPMDASNPFLGAPPANSGAPLK
jgi:hypothetical protein